MAAALTFASCGSAMKTQSADGSAASEGSSAASNGGSTTNEDGKTTTKATAREYDLANQLTMIQSNNAFALRLFGCIEGNASAVVSPLSVTYLMSMLANGAGGATLSEILTALGWTGKQPDEINALCAMEMDKASKADPQVEVSIANYIAVSKNQRLNDTFRSTVEDNYKAGIESLDFASQSAVKHINDWCSNHTDGMIPKIVEQLDPNAIACLMNAIYFNGTWTSKFSKDQTRKEHFRGYTRDIKQVDMMHQSGKFMYADNDMFAAVSLPYGNRSYRMVVLLPNEGKSLADVTATLDTKAFANVLESMEQCIVDLKLPRFSVETELPLNDIVAKLGAPSMFKPGVADFNRMATGQMCISKMLQKAKIEVEEEGTRAAAVTVGVMVGASLRSHEPRRVEFHANRPFAYIITDSNGAIVFIGRYTGN